MTEHNSADRDAAVLLARLAADDAAVERIRLHVEQLHGRNYGTVAVRRTLRAAVDTYIFSSAEGSE